MCEESTVLLEDMELENSFKKLIEFLSKDKENLITRNLEKFFQKYKTKMPYPDSAVGPVFSHWLPPYLEGILNIESIMTMSFNHYFDDFYSVYDLKKKEAQKIRSFFNLAKSYGDWGFVKVFYKKFGEYLEEERKEFIKGINEDRKERGLEELKIPELEI